MKMQLHQHMYAILQCLQASYIGKPLDLLDVVPKKLSAKYLHPPLKKSTGSTFLILFKAPMKLETRFCTTEE